MKPDVTELRRHYASMSDDALLAIERSDLTDVAQRCYDEEVAKRRIAPGDDAAEATPESDVEIEPDWLENAAGACSFDSFPGQDGTHDLEEARGILESAEIPCHVQVTQLDESQGGPQPHYLYELLVPGSRILPATSILDQKFFNPRLEAQWETHLAELSDEDFRSLRIEDLTAGAQDRVERLKHAFREEQIRRSR